MRERVRVLCVQAGDEKSAQWEMKRAAVQYPCRHKELKKRYVTQNKLKERTKSAKRKKNYEIKRTLWRERTKREVEQRKEERKEKYI